MANRWPAVVGIVSERAKMSVGGRKVKRENGKLIGHPLAVSCVDQMHILRQVKVVPVGNVACQSTVVRVTSKMKRVRDNCERCE